MNFINKGSQSYFSEEQEGSFRLATKLKEGIYGMFSSAEPTDDIENQLKALSPVKDETGSGPMMSFGGLGSGGFKWRDHTWGFGGGSKEPQSPV